MDKSRSFSLENNIARATFAPYASILRVMFETTSLASITYETSCLINTTVNTL